MAVGAYLRFAGLSGAGIFGVDDGRYVLDGLAKANELRFGWELVEAKRAEAAGGPELSLAETLPAAMNGLADPHPFSPKMGFAYAIAMVLLRGFTVSAGNYVEAFFGTLLIAVTFGFVRYISNARAGLIAAAFIAISAYCVYFSRNTYPQFISACFVVGALWLQAAWLRREGGLGWLFGSGVLAGVSFWTNYQAAGALPLVALVHLFTCFRRARGTYWFVLGGSAMAVGFACVMIAAEALSYPMIMLFRSQGLTYPQATFIETLWPRLTGQTAAPFNATGLVLFPYFAGLFHGWFGAIALAALLAVGLFAAIPRAREAYAPVWVYFGLAFLVPFAIFSLKTMQGARMFTYALPFFAALIGIAVHAAWQANGGGRVPMRIFTGIMVTVFLVSNGIALFEVRGIRSAYPDAIAFARAQDDPRLCAAWSSSLRCYTIAAEMDGGDLYRYLGTGEAAPRWFVNDWQELYARRYPDEPVALEVGAVPVHAFEHGFGRIFLEVEALPSHGDTLANLRWVRGLDLARARALLVYDLRSIALRTRD